MGRELKRVPLDFDYPLHKVWYGYYHQHINFCHEEHRAGCNGCKAYARIKGIPVSQSGCPEFEDFYGLGKGLPVEPPEGYGYQLWETTSEGAPISPVFETLDALCGWCETNATVFADRKATKEKWKSMLEDDFVYHQDGAAIFL